MGRKQSKKAI